MKVENSSYNQLRKLQNVCLKQNIPFASYRLPLDKEIITLVQHHSMAEKLESLNKIDKKVGFIFAPFLEAVEHGTYFLKPDCVYFSDEINDTYIKKLAENNRFLSVSKPENRVLTTTSTEYIENVNKAVEAINNGDLIKVVVSKVRVEEFPLDLQPEEFFIKLCDKYPHAMVYFVQLPGVGCWMGATPEPLLIIEDKIVKTVSLAGTQISTGKEIMDYSWSSKEFEEQRIVTDFVAQTLQSLNIENSGKVGPTNYQAGNLIHLKTAFEFPLQKLESRLGNFLKALHPTPSVGGLPKVEARNFILANEKHDRSYYTGFLGPINIENKTDLFVNLRCMQLFNKQFILYSGAGITASSVAEREWEETDNKMMTMMNAMMTPKP